MANRGEEDYQGSWGDTVAPYQEGPGEDDATNTTEEEARLTEALRNQVAAFFQSMTTSTGADPAKSGFIGPKDASAMLLAAAAVGYRAEGDDEVTPVRLEHVRATAQMIYRDEEDQKMFEQIYKRGNAKGAMFASTALRAIRLAELEPEQWIPIYKAGHMTQIYIPELQGTVTGKTGLEFSDFLLKGWEATRVTNVTTGAWDGILGEDARMRIFDAVAMYREWVPVIDWAEELAHSEAALEEMEPGLTDKIRDILNESPRKCMLPVSFVDPVPGTLYIGPTVQRAAVTSQLICSPTDIVLVLEAVLSVCRRLDLCPVLLSSHPAARRYSSWLMACHPVMTIPFLVCSYHGAAMGILAEQGAFMPLATVIVALVRLARPDIKSVKEANEYAQAMLKGTVVVRHSWVARLRTGVIYVHVGNRWDAVGSLCGLVEKDPKQGNKVVPGIAGGGPDDDIRHLKGEIVPICYTSGKDEDLIALLTRVAGQSGYTYTVNGALEPSQVKEQYTWMQGALDPEDDETPLKVAAMPSVHVVEPLDPAKVYRPMTAFTTNGKIKEEIWQVAAEICRKMDTVYAPHTVSAPEELSSGPARNPAFNTLVGLAIGDVRAYTFARGEGVVPGSDEDLETFKSEVMAGIILERYMKGGVPHDALPSQMNVTKRLGKAAARVWPIALMLVDKDTVNGKDGIEERYRVSQVTASMRAASGGGSMPALGLAIACYVAASWGLGYWITNDKIVFATATAYAKMIADHPEEFRKAAGSVDPSITTAGLISALSAGRETSQVQAKIMQLMNTLSSHVTNALAKPRAKTLTATGIILRAEAGQRAEETERMLAEILPSETLKAMAEEEQKRNAAELAERNAKFFGVAAPAPEPTEIIFLEEEPRGDDEE